MRTPLLYRTLCYVPKVSTIERFHCSRSVPAYCIILVRTLVCSLWLEHSSIATHAYTTHTHTQGTKKDTE